MRNVVKLFLLTALFISSSFGAKYLSPQKAFKVSATMTKEAIETRIVLGKDIHLYQDKLQYRVVKPKEITLNVALPKAEKLDEDMVYRDEVLVTIPLSEISSQLKNNKFTLMIELQGCADSGLCYNPIEKEFTFTLAEKQKGFLDKVMGLTSASNAGTLVDVLKAENSFFIVFLFFILGLLLALTPCIFPMIPILSSILVAQSEGKKQSAVQGFLTSLVYVLSMAITYTLVGVFSGLLGADIQSIMQNPWVLTAFSMMFLALAFSLFGYYEIQLPSKWQSKISSASDNAQGKGFVGVMIMGFLSAFIIGPCVAPPLAGAVLFISQTGNAFLGGLALFMMSIGMGFPLLLIGLGASRFMPKPGGWMENVSKTFGVIMLGLSIFMLSKVVSAQITMLLWALLFMGVSLFMGVFSSDSKQKMLQLTGLVSLIYGVSLLVAFLSGGTSILHPFEKFTTASSTMVEHVNEEKIEAHQGYSLVKLQKEIEKSTKPVLVEFSKKSCSACRELEEFTFSNDEVKKALKHFTFISIDITNHTKDEIAILKKYNLFGTPNMIFFDGKNNFLPKKSLTGFLDASHFLEHLKGIEN